VTGELAAAAILLAAYALFAARLERWSIGPAMAFVAIGVVASASLFGGLTYDASAEAVKLLAEAALTLLLFADASEISSRALRRDAGPVVRLLLVGLPLTIIAGTAGAALLFPAASLGICLLIGSALAPTDAALGQPVVTNPAVPARVRRILNVESGLNDGIATPFVFLAIGLAGAEATGYSAWLSDALVDFTIGVVTGIALGALGGKLLDIGLRRGWASVESSRLFVLALALACYLGAGALGANGFIAAFVGGLAFGTATRHRDERSVRFTARQGSLLAIGVWAAFGLILAREVGTDLWNVSAITFAVLSLTVIRMVPVALAFIGSGFAARTVVFMGWFGPRGLASIVFLVIGLEGLREQGVIAGPVAVTISWTVLLSVILHGLSAGPLSARFGRWTHRLREGSPELDDASQAPHDITLSRGSIPEP
jgi:NhaP-type Na+/H+ or K+/H+ antiporter